MADFSKKRFNKAMVVLDGNTFEQCEFNACTLVFSGVADVKLTGSKITDCNWRFDGPAARTAQFMSAMYASGSGGKELIDATFRQLTGAAAPAMPEPALN
ncbi:MAG: hypothetical protein R3E48_18045 [Burkholderiaceae bacterium]